MRLLALLVILLFTFGLAALVGCNPGTGGNGDTNNDPLIAGLLALEAMPRSVVPGGTTTVVASASDPDEGDTLTYAWSVDDDALGTIEAGSTEGTAIFTAAADAPDGSVVTVTLTVTDGDGATVSASVEITITSSAAFLVPEGTANGYVGSDTCGRCHSRFVGYWSGGAHASASYADARPGGDDFDATWTNVQCEDCHGPGRDHATNPSQRSTAEVPWDQINIPDYTICQTCHSEGTSAPAAWTDWAGIEGDENRPISGHADAMSPMNNRDGECLDCHSADRIEHHQEVIAPVTAATLVSDPITAEAPITCLVCHSAHSVSVRDPNRSDSYGSASLCMECHTSTSEGPGWDAGRNAPEQPRWNPAANVIQGQLGFNEDGTPIAEEASIHAGVTDADGNTTLCIVCHVHPTEATTGHRFLFREDDLPSGCVCHPGGPRDDVRTDIDARLAALRPYMPGRTGFTSSFTRDQYDALSEADQARFQIAVWNYALISRDASLGAHNPDFADEVLDVAEAVISDLAGVSL